MRIGHAYLISGFQVTASVQYCRRRRHHAAASFRRPSFPLIPGAMVAFTWRRRRRRRRRQRHSRWRWWHSALAVVATLLFAIHNWVYRQVLVVVVFGNGPEEGKQQPRGLFERRFHSSFVTRTWWRSFLSSRPSLPIYPRGE